MAKFGEASRSGLKAWEVREMPESVPIRKMIGPSAILLGASLGSGELILWPNLVSQYGFAIFWAAMLGILTQYFVNMEIERYTLATGETAVTGFCRLWGGWAPFFLVCNILGWLWPAWATGAGKFLEWTLALLFQSYPVQQGEQGYYLWYGMAMLIGCGLVLTLGPVVYRTMEKIQFVLVGLILIFVAILVGLIVRADTLAAMTETVTRFGHIPPGINTALFLTAVAYAGAGGSMNLCQSNWIRDKGYGMGAHIGRIVSPFTHEPEAVASTGYILNMDSEGMSRWKKWWKAANTEHFVTFFVLGALSIVLLSALAFATVHGTAEEQFAFLFQEGQVLAERIGPSMQIVFFLTGLAILLSTELAILDGMSRVGADIVKVNFLSQNENWTQNRLYFLILWSEIIFGCVVLLMWGERDVLGLFLIGGSLNGIQMFFYSALLFYINGFRLPAEIRTSKPRKVAMAWAALFYGFFALMLLRDLPGKIFG